MAKTRQNVKDMMTRAVDSFQNLVSGLGTSKDKSIATRYVVTMLTDDQLEAAYRGDWIARKIVDIPAEDATREWRDWNADEEQVKALEVEERRLQIKQKVNEALWKARLWGGAALVLGVGNDDAAKPLDPSAVQQGGLRFVHVVSRREIGTGPIDMDPLSEGYGVPTYYSVHSRSLVEATIHPSRVVRLIGKSPPRVDQANGWGDSVLQALDDAIKNAGMSSQALAAMMQEAKTDVVKMPDFMENVGTEEYQNKILERFTLVSMAQSIVNTKFLDKEEEWNRLQTNFSGLPDAVKLYLLIASGAADIPATRMLGQSAAGLNATGEGDLRNYYDMIRAGQQNVLGPAMNTLDEVLVRSALGDRPDGLDYKWRPLWQPSEAERATIAKTKAETFQIHNNSGLLEPRVLGEGLVNQLVEDDVYPGLSVSADEALAEQPDVDEVDLEPEEDDFELGDALKRRDAARRVMASSHLERDTKRAILSDAAPRTLYARRDVVNSDEIAEWAIGQGLEPVDDMHVTIVYSRQPVDWLKAGEPWVMGPGADDGLLTVPPGGPRLVEAWDARDGGQVLVLQFASSALSYRHEDILYRTEAQHDFDEYIPHVTIVKGEGLDAEGVEPYRGQIVLGPEVFEEIDDRPTVDVQPHPVRKFGTVKRMEDGSLRFEMKEEADD